MLNNRGLLTAKANEAELFSSMATSKAKHTHNYIL